MFSTGSTNIRRMSFRGGFLDHSDELEGCELLDK
jgi:hypothetical protein